MSAKVSHAIKGRKNAKDVFITPLDLAKNHIDMIDAKEGERWLDCCKNSGAYYNQFPTRNKDYCEILEDKDFLEYDGKVDIICSNPPYSILDEWFKKSIELNPRVISYLIGLGNLTARRIEWMEQAGYGMSKMTMLKVQSWYGMSVIVVFEKEKKSIIEIDRKVYRCAKEEEEEDPPPKYVEKEVEVPKRKKKKFRIMVGCCVEGERVPLENLAIGCKHCF